MSVKDTLVALSVAPLGACAAFVLNNLLIGSVRPEVGLAGASGLAVLIVLGIVYLYSLIAGVVLTLPILIMVPRYRNPSFLLAAAWGSAAACIAGRIVLGATWGPGIAGWGRLPFFALLGAAAGLAYAAVIKIRRSAAG